MVTEITRGDVVWADFGPVRGRGPAKLRPAVVVQSDRLNHSRIGTITVAPVTSKTANSGLGGNVFVPSWASGLPRDSVVIVTRLTTFSREELGMPVGRLDSAHLKRVDDGLRQALGLR